MLEKNIQAVVKSNLVRGSTDSTPGDGRRVLDPPPWDAMLVTQGFEQLACRLRRC